MTANVAPAAVAQLMEAAMAGDMAEARAWQDKLIYLHKALFLDASPAPTKFALAELRPLRAAGRACRSAPAPTR